MIEYWVRFDRLVITLAFATGFFKSPSSSRELNFTVDNRDILFNQFFFKFNKPVVRVINSVVHFIKGVISAWFPTIVFGYKKIAVSWELFILSYCTQCRAVHTWLHWPQYHKILGNPSVALLMLNARRVTLCALDSHCPLSWSGVIMLNQFLGTLVHPVMPNNFSWQELSCTFINLQFVASLCLLQIFSW